MAARCSMGYMSIRAGCVARHAAHGESRGEITPSQLRRPLSGEKPRHGPERGGGDVVLDPLRIGRRGAGVDPERA